MKKHVAYLWFVDSIEIIIKKQMTRITLNPSVRFMSLDVQKIAIDINYNDMAINMILDDKLNLWYITFNKNIHEYVRFWTVIPELQIYSEIAEILLDYSGELIYLKESKFFEELIPILPYYKIRMDNKVYRLSNVILNRVLEEGFLPTSAIDLIINKISVGDITIVSKDFNSIGIEEDAISTYLLIRELVPIQILKSISMDDSLDFNAYLANRLTTKLISLEKALTGDLSGLVRLTNLENDGIDETVNELLDRNFPFVRKYLRKSKKGLETR